MVVLVVVHPLRHLSRPTGGLWPEAGQGLFVLADGLHAEQVWPRGIHQYEWINGAYQVLTAA